ncbi:4Fe-4S domain-containing protein [Aedoeadaptatus coxii]|nr:ferredoxin [Peptoniphilus coxii]
MCPEVFSMTDEDKAKAIETEVLADSEAAAEEAKDSCPVGAIEEA